ncbi:hypothetical protein [Paenibacillus taiwanensis]|uniref:hypothetical protein n=1 Tax=Paenibacillus taiwanensis TaxID=401638 RepID=UPI00048A4E55|nr:hypothetical protein [Paenibacillus taiwanensis]
MAWMHAGSEPTESISESCERLRQEIRDWRVSVGKSPEPPDNEKFLGVPLSSVLVSRIQPFKAIAVKYASIIAQGVVVPINTAELDEYRKYFRLLCHSKGLFCGLVGTGGLGVLRIMDDINNAIEEGAADRLNLTDSMRQLHFCIELLNHDSGFDYYDHRSDVSGHEQRAVITKEIERLEADPAAQQSEIDAAWAYYIEMGEADE